MKVNEIVHGISGVSKTAFSTHSLKLAETVPDVIVIVALGDKLQLTFFGYFKVTKVVHLLVLESK